MIPSPEKVSMRALVEIDADGQIMQITPEARAELSWQYGDLISQRILDHLVSGRPVVTVSGKHGSQVRLKSYGSRSMGWLLVAVNGPPATHAATADNDVASAPHGDLAYRAFFEQAPIGIVHLDQDGRVTFENHQLRRIYGEGPDEAWIGRSIFSIPAFDRFLLPLVGAMIKDGKSFDARESTLSDVPGLERWLRVSGTPIRNMDGATAGGVMTVQDITDLKLAERLMQRAREDAEVSSRMKTDLIATLSHELRTPVGTIRGYATMLSDELDQPGRSDERVREFAAVIRERARDLESLVGDLVEFAHLESGLITPQMQETNVADLLCDVVDRTAASHDNPVKIVVDVQPQVKCFADATRLQSVLSRVLDNALKYTPEGHVKVTAAETNGTMRIEVVDTGIGMDPSYVSRVFDPFSQAESVLNRRFEGAGLGLALARRFIEMMGGAISVESTCGEGTCVTIALPAKRGE